MTELQTIISRLQELQAKLPEAPTTLKEFSKGQVVYAIHDHEYRVTSYDGAILRVTHKSGYRLTLHKHKEGAFGLKSDYYGNYRFYASATEAQTALKYLRIRTCIKDIGREIHVLDVLLA